jgi:hypothetical protein
VLARIICLRICTYNSMLCFGNRNISDAVKGTCCNAVVHTRGCLRRKCQLDPDSLQPVAQLCNLQELYFWECTGLTTSCLESFLRAAVQGSGLEVYINFGEGKEEEAVEEMLAMYESLVESVGAKNVPILDCA